MSAKELLSQDEIDALLHGVDNGNVEVEMQPPAAPNEARPFNFGSQDRIVRGHADRIVVMRDGLVRQVGTPELLFDRPAHPDVADFMGYRNVVDGRVTAAADGTIDVDLAGTRIQACAMEPLQVDEIVSVAIRPDDLVVVAEGPLSVRTETSEYRGHDFYCSGTTDTGATFFFSSPVRLAQSQQVRLSCNPDRVLAYKRDERI